MDIEADFKEFQNNLQSALISTTRVSKNLNDEDLGFYRSIDSSVGRALDKQNARLLSFATRLLANAVTGPQAVGPALQDADSLEHNWRGVVDVVDSMLEKADTALDEYTGIVKRLSPGREQSPAPLGKIARKFGAFRNQDLTKPQKLFEHVPQNNETGAFKPFLSAKPHATVPLNDTLRKTVDEDGKEKYPHPYQVEIENYRYPPSVYAKADPVPFTPFEQTTATFVDTPEAVEEMLQELKKATEIAIDLEHHDARSYIGIVSLMQISTRNKDWIVDTLKPWRRRLECLNQVFADPNILKVLHGAYMDIVWLQRDLGLYIVGLFDTHHASRVLGYPGGSLAFLLQKFINFTAQKQYQMADWRIRPLPKEMFDYARSDTHFLLYIYDNMRNELIDRSDLSDPEKDRILQVWQKSKETSLKTYKHPVYDQDRGLGPMGWYKLLSRTPARFSKEQFSVFRALHRWRDAVARQEDEGIFYVMPNHALFSIARQLPENKAALFSSVQTVSPILRLRGDDVVALIHQAKAAGANGPSMEEVLDEIQKIMPMPDIAYMHSMGYAKKLVDQDKASKVASNALVLRSKVSDFWGLTLTNSAQGQRRTIVSENISLAIPLPPLSAEIFVDTADATAVQQQQVPQNPASRAEHPYMKESERPTTKADDGIFTIKQLGKRKREEPAPREEESEEGRLEESESESGSEDVGLEVQPETDEQSQELQKDVISLKDFNEGEERAPRSTMEKKKLKRKEKKERRRERKDKRKEKKKQPGSQSGPPADEKPFDYANAPSVLYAQRDQDPRGTSGDFNPYLKGMDAPRRLRRAKMEKTGKSGTFKM